MQLNGCQDYFLTAPPGGWRDLNCHCCSFSVETFMQFLAYKQHRRIFLAKGQPKWKNKLKNKYCQTSAVTMVSFGFLVFSQRWIKNVTVILNNIPVRCKLTRAILSYSFIISTYLCIGDQNYKWSLFTSRIWQRCLPKKWGTQNLLVFINILDTKNNMLKTEDVVAFESGMAVGWFQPTAISWIKREQSKQEKMSCERHKMLFSLQGRMHRLVVD